MNNFLPAVRTFDWNDILSEGVSVTFEKSRFSLDKIQSNNFQIRLDIVTNKHLGIPWITPEVKELNDRKSQQFELYSIGAITHGEKNSIKSVIS